MNRLPALADYDIIFVTGDPGSGKSRIASDYAGAGAMVVSTGDIIRASSPEAIADGTMGPETVVRDGVIAAVQAASEVESPLIIDGFPRKPEQVFFAMGIGVWARVAVLWVQIETDLAISRYRSTDSCRCTRCSKLGKRGEYCVCGGEYVIDDAPAFYERRRGLQASELEATLKLLQEVNRPPFYLWRAE